MRILYAPMKNPFSNREVLILSLKDNVALQMWINVKESIKLRCLNKNVLLFRPISSDWLAFHHDVLDWYQKQIALNWSTPERVVSS